MIPIHVLSGSFRFYLTEIRRYAFNTVSGLVTLYLIFLALFYGTQAVAGPGGALGGAFGHTLEGLVVGFFVWSVALIGLSELGYSITQEAQQGTLEQLFLSPWGFGWVAAGRLLGAFVTFTVANSALLGLMLLTSGQRLHLHWPSILPLLLATLLQAAAIGLVGAGLAVLYKRIQSAMQILQFAAVGLIALPPSGLAAYLPLNKTSKLMQDVMVHGALLSQAPSADLLEAAAITAGWIILGGLFFRRCVNLARRRGLLSRY